MLYNRILRSTGENDRIDSQPQSFYRKKFLAARSDRDRKGKKMIREANEKDLEDILMIYNEAILNTTAVYTYKPETLKDRKQWYERKVNEGFPILVYEEGNKVRGFATFGTFRAWPAYKYSIEHSIYVDKQYRNKGIASSLMEEIIQLAEEKDYMILVAGIDATNKGSITFHEKFGFEHAGTIKKAGYKFNQWLDLAFYQLELSGPEHPTEE